MNLSTLDRKAFKRKRVTRIELEGMFSRVRKTRDYLAEIDAIHSEKILALVADNPKLGPKRLSDSLMAEGISIEPIHIYMLLVKHNLNRKSLRMAWQDRVKEIYL
jgi:hypothetical protein